MTPIEKALAFVVATLAALAPIHEGLRDLASLNLTRGTLEEIKAAIAQYDRRVARLMSLKTALEALIADGDLLPREMPAAALKELQENYQTIAAALRQFLPGTATGLGLVANPAEPK